MNQQRPTDLEGKAFVQPTPESNEKSSSISYQDVLIQNHYIALGFHRALAAYAKEQSSS